MGTEVTCDSTKKTTNQTGDANGNETYLQGDSGTIDRIMIPAEESLLEAILTHWKYSIFLMEKGKAGGK